jgi:Zn-dependent protease with chaperone function
VTRLQFHELVERLDRRYEGRAAALSRATAIWLLAGCAVLFSGLALALAGGLAMIVLGVWLAHQSAVWLVAAGVVVILLGLGIYAPLIWTPRRSPQELVLADDDAPALQDLIERIRQALGCRPFQRVLLTAELNAGVATEPRFGLLGCSRNVLRLGLPLMEIVSSDEFASVLAHEFVHHSRAHGRFSVWVYRVRSSWERVFADLESGQKYRALRWVRWFLRWYWPRLHARAFLLCREHEYQADRFAAEYVSPTASVMSLFRIETTDRYLDLAFWPEFQRGPEKSALPPRDLMTRLLASLAASSAAQLGPWCAATTLVRLTDTADTHPAWADRTAALGEDLSQFAGLEFPRRPIPSAAQTLLGQDWSRLSQRVSDSWADAVKEAWSAQHRRMCGLRRRLEQIKPLVEARPRDVSLRWEQACLVKELEGPAALPPFLEYLHNLDPPHRAATFELGQIALAQGDPSGTALLAEFVDQQHDSFYEPACQALGSFFRLTGRFDEMREMEARLDGRDAWAEWIRDGHRHLARGVSCVAHDLLPAELAPLSDLLGRQDQLVAAWLARAGNRAPGSPALFILCVAASPGPFGWRGAATEKRLARNLVSQVSLPGRVLIISRRGPDRRLARRVRAVPGALVFPVLRR